MSPPLPSSFPDVAALEVTVTVEPGAGDETDTRTFDGTDLPEHVACPDCGVYVDLRWPIADVLAAGQPRFEVTVPCPGERDDGGACGCTFVADGTAEYA